MRKLLEVRHLRASYGGRRILEDVSLHVGEGEIVTVIGHNGAGKSTLLKSIFRLVPWSEGEVLLDDRPIQALAPNRILAAGVAFVPQHRSVFPKLTIGENLWMGGYLVDDKALLSRRLRDVEDLFPVLAERRGQVAGTLSGGEQRMLEVARTLLTDPRVIMLDEPSIGLAPKMVDAVFDTVGLLRSRGKAVLMVEQNVKKALAASDRGYVMTLGEIKLEDQAQRLIGDPRVEQLYMGQKGVRAIFP
jgi:branched-chain amino acid transport system ATP-binding protein